MKARGNLGEHFAELNPLVPVRVVTVVPGIEYYGKLEAIGADHVVLSTDFHTVAVALAHIVSVHREPLGIPNPGHRNHSRVTARTLSTQLPGSADTLNVGRRKAPPGTRSRRGWSFWFSRRRSQQSTLASAASGTG